jgi:hypothetical protein
MVCMRCSKISILSKALQVSHLNIKALKRHTALRDERSKQAVSTFCLILRSPSPSPSVLAAIKSLGGVPDEDGALCANTHDVFLIRGNLDLYRVIRCVN